MLVTVIITQKAGTLKTQELLFILPQESKQELERLNLACKVLALQTQGPGPT